MGFLSKVSTVALAQRASGRSDAWSDGRYAPSEWISSLAAGGIVVTADMAMTLAAFYCGVTTIAYDLATLPLQVFRQQEDGGKQRIRPGVSTPGGIGHLAYLLRWQPNSVQTATEYMVGMAAQFLMRGKAYAEIQPGPSGFAEQLLPRHPDRVRAERLPSGRLRYRLMESSGTPRFLTQDEMLVVRDLSFDGGVTSTSRVEYGGASLALALATQHAASKFFKSGLTASVVATYKGDLDEPEEDALHKSITRYATGVDNSFGLMLIPDDVTISSLSVSPEKAQMLATMENGVRDVARLLRMPPHKLMIAGTQTYASSVQASLDYVVTCLRPTAVCFEQAVQRDLILAKDSYFSEFKLEALLRGDFEAQANYLSKFIEKRIMRPSEARLILNMNPDEDLDRLSEGDMRPGQPAPAKDQSRGATSRAALKSMLIVHDKAAHAVRRERLAVEKLAKKHASDVEGWHAALREFYSDHAGFIAETLRLPSTVARNYAAQHGSELEAQGVIWMTDAWAREESDELAALALEPAA